MIFLFTCFRFKNFCMLNENGRLGLEGGRRDLSSENKFSKLKLVIVFLADANFEEKNSSDFKRSQICWNGKWLWFVWYGPGGTADIISKTSQPSLSQWSPDSRSNGHGIPASHWLPILAQGTTSTNQTRSCWLLGQNHPIRDRVVKHLTDIRPIAGDDKIGDFDGYPAHGTEGGGALSDHTWCFIIGLNGLH